ncbi:MAG: radical SAM protein [bacterium]
MHYTPTSAVWEITYACNMRCKHCGSGCGEKYPDELTGAEALKLCDDLRTMGLKILTLSGGEPFLREDWHLIATRLTENNITTNIISNGWYIDKSILDKAHTSGIVNIGVSLDGCEDTHDFMRKKGAFERVLSALDLMNKHRMPSVVCTTITKKNLNELFLLKDILIQKKVQRWQLQMACPMGNLLDYPELVLEPRNVDDIINFAYIVMQEKKIIVDLASDIGYYNLLGMEIKKRLTDNKKQYIWKGCPAGKYNFGIMANGNIIGCLSIRDEKFIEGNIREIPLKELWTRPGAFAWNRNLTKEQLTGFCGKCQYGAYCLGGCSGAKIFLSKSLYENNYCSYKLAIERETQKIDHITNCALLVYKSRSFINAQEYQLAAIYLSKALALDPENTEAMDLLGCVNFSLGNFTACRELNEKALQLNPHNAYAWKGLGVCVASMGNIEDGIDYLKKAIELADPGFTDPYHDLAVIFYHDNRIAEAINILEEGFKKSDKFKEDFQEFCNLLKEKQK